jgi:hypothetical protein
MKEQWKKYPHNNNYSISNLGKVRNDKNFKELKGWIKGSGYKQTYIGLIHRMVLETFVGPFPKDKPYTNHIDGNKLNNRLDNLEYTNHSLNAIHAHKTNLIKQSKKIKVYKKENKELIGEYYSISDAAYELTGDRNNNANIIKALKGKIKSCYGFIYEYSS